MAAILLKFYLAAIVTHSLMRLTGMPVAVCKQSGHFRPQDADCYAGGGCYVGVGLC